MLDMIGHIDMREDVRYGTDVLVRLCDSSEVGCGNVEKLGYCFQGDL
jgi:hypothetical protein